MKALDFNFDLNLVQTQKLLLTPQLKQALEILKMTSQELFEFVEEELEKNPVLDALENDDNCGGVSGKEASEESGWDEEGYIIDRVDSALDRATVELTLKEHLMFQLNMSDLDKELRLVGEYLIDNIDENGYLSIDLPEAAAFFNLPVSKVKKALNLVQTFDPPGICARNLKESLLIQLKSINCSDEAIIKIVENHLDELAENKIAQVAKSTKLDIQKVVEAFDFIRTLEPKPGRAFSGSEEVKYIIPDVIIRRIDGNFVVIVNDDAIPLIGINEYYKRVLNQNISSEARKFIKNKMDSAIWLIKCIEQRRSTLRKVAECIVERQKEFLEQGRLHIKPLTMKEIAEEIGMHESTISRTLSAKYLQCTWGVFEMRYFFSGKLSSVSGELIASQNVKEELKELIKKEDKKNPLSDSEIAEIFNGKGLNISRRTVAKYRAEMEIPSGSKRRKF